MTWTEAIAAAPGVFLFGVAVGLLISSRYRVRRVNGRDNGPPP